MAEARRPLSEPELDEAVLDELRARAQHEYEAYEFNPNKVVDIVLVSLAAQGITCRGDELCRSLERLIRTNKLWVKVHLGNPATTKTLELWLAVVAT